MLRMSEQMAARIRAHGVETYPHECCGAILGLDHDGRREVMELLPLANQRNDSPRNRFEITPQDVRLADLKAQELKCDLIGWYHSHPDHPARPSEFDREHAWPWYSYVIVGIEQGCARDMNSWLLAEDRSHYDQEAVEIVAASERVVRD